MDRTALESLCQLARLRLDEAEAEAFTAKFESLLQFVDRVQAYEPQPSGQTLGGERALDLRRDVPRRWSWSPGVHDYRVPKVIDFEGEG